MEEVNTIPNMSNESNIINIPFKFFSNDYRIETDILNTMTLYYDVDLSNDIHLFISNISYNIKRDFGISTFELVPSQFGEFGQDIKQYLMSQYDNYENINISKVITNQSGFYVRPISLTNGDLDSLKKIYERLIVSEICQLCSTRSYQLSRYFTCTHEICAHCYVTWNTRLAREPGVITCPICR
jgi:hypothetical protein